MRPHAQGRPAWVEGKRAAVKPHNLRLWRVTFVPQKNLTGFRWYEVRVHVSAEDCQDASVPW